MQANTFTLPRTETLYLQNSIIGGLELFTEEAYREIIYDSLDYCIIHKNLRIHGYALQGNTLHLIASAPKGTMAKIMKSFKQFTAKQLLKTIPANEHDENRLTTMRIFEEAGTQNPRNKQYQVWNHGVVRQLLINQEQIDQKIAQIHQQPIQKDVVQEGKNKTHSSLHYYEEDLTPYIPIQRITG